MIRPILISTLQTMHAALTAAGLKDMSRVVKTLVLKDKKKGGIYLVVVRSTLKVDIAKIVTKNLGLSSGALRNADAETITETLAAEVGHINPLAVMNDNTNKVTLVVDSALLSGGDTIYCHPMRNHVTIGMKVPDFEKFWEKFGHPARSMDLEGAEEAAPADKPAGKPAAQPKVEAKPEKALDVKGETKLGMQHTKAGDFPKWYQEVKRLL